MDLSNISVAIVGLGRVGSALAILLSRQQFIEVRVYDRNLGKLNTLGEWPNAPVTVFATVEEAIVGADLVFLAVQDRYIDELAQSLAGLLSDVDLTKHLFAHLSGSLTAVALQPLADSGALTFSLHPLQSLADVEGAVKGLAGSYFSFEGDVQALPVAEQVVKVLSGHLVQLAGADKALYHAAAVVSSNFFIALEEMAITLMSGIGVDADTAQKMLLPLIRGSFENLERVTPAEALTGPIARGDDQTVAVHLQALQAKFPNHIEAYRLLAGLNVDLAEKKCGVSYADFPSLITDKI
ncbi:DUF2520 domain-containing protein [bacterium]|nr:DUF2520 domain-containing protein [bacterium]